METRLSLCASLPMPMYMSCAQIARYSGVDLARSLIAQTQYYNDTIEQTCHINREYEKYLNDVSVKNIMCV
jgi:hypothetical protein